MTTETTTERRAWVGCLSCYNDGALFGDWLSAEECAGPLAETAPALAHVGWYEPANLVGKFDQCTRCGGDEWWCLDVDGLPSALVAEMSPGDFAKVAELLDELDSDGYDLDAFGVYLAHDSGGELVDRAEAFREAFCGTHDSGADYAYELAEDIGAIPKHVEWPCQCIDWQAAWRELEMGGDYWSAPDGFGHVYVFRGV